MVPPSNVPLLFPNKIVSELFQFHPKLFHHFYSWFHSVWIHPLEAPYLVLSPNSKTIFLLSILLCILGLVYFDYILWKYIFLFIHIVQCISLSFLHPSFFCLCFFFLIHSLVHFIFQQTVVTVYNFSFILFQVTSTCSFCLLPLIVILIYFPLFLADLHFLFLQSYFILESLTSFLLLDVKFVQKLFC